MADDALYIIITHAYNTKRGKVKSYRGIVEV